MILHFFAVLLGIPTFAGLRAHKFVRWYYIGGVWYPRTLWFS